MAKESMNSARSLFSVNGNTITCNIAGRSGVYKTKLTGHDGMQRYVTNINGAGLDICVKQAQGLELPNFTVDIPTNLQWKSTIGFNGKESLRVQFPLVLGTTPVEIQLRKDGVLGTTPAPVVAPHQPAMPTTKPVAATTQPSAAPRRRSKAAPKGGKAEAAPTPEVVVANHKAASVVISDALSSIIAQAVARGIAEALANHK